MAISGRFVRVTMADGNVCPDCLYIEAFQPAEGLTYEELVSRGWVPGSGGTVCGTADRCTLIPVEYLDEAEVTAEVDLKIDRFIYITLGAAGVKQIGRAPAHVAEFKALLREAREAGYDEAELERLLAGLTLIAMIEALRELLNQ